MIHALSFDVEEYFHVHAFSGIIDPNRWDDYSSRVDVGTNVILETLARADVRATFFVLGWVARRNARLVRAIVAAGHELASHGYQHRRVDEQTPDAFRLDVRAAKELLEEIAGVSVTGYRAPSFSITAKAPWAHQILVEEGYTLDSSMAAGRRGRSSEPARDEPFVVETPAGPLWEYPLPAKWGVPVGGGGYFRLFPEWVTRRALRSIESAGRPFCVYLHPWEFDPGQPQIDAPRATTFRQRVGLAKMPGRLRRLVGAFRFGTMTESLMDHAVERREGRSQAAVKRSFVAS